MIHTPSFHCASRVSTFAVMFSFCFVLFFVAQCVLGCVHSHHPWTASCLSVSLSVSLSLQKKKKKKKERERGEEHVVCLVGYDASASILTRDATACIHGRSQRCLPSHIRPAAMPAATEASCGLDGVRGEEGETYHRHRVRLGAGPDNEGARGWCWGRGSLADVCMHGERDSQLVPGSERAPTHVQRVAIGTLPSARARTARAA